MRDTPRPRRRVSRTTLRLTRPLFRYSAARDAYVLRVANGQYGPVLVDKTSEPVLERTFVSPTGRFTRDGATETPEPRTKTRQH